MKKSVAQKNKTYLNFYKGHTSTLKEASPKKSEVKNYFSSNLRGCSTDGFTVNDKFNRDLINNLNPQPLVRQENGGRMSDLTKQAKINVATNSLVKKQMIINMS